jgi:hypothetical protein
MLIDSLRNIAQSEAIFIIDKIFITRIFCLHLVFSRFMMNGILMSGGIDAISVFASKVREFNEKMVRFYLSKAAEEMMEFMVGCYESN